MLMKREKISETSKNYMTLSWFWIYYLLDLILKL